MATVKYFNTETNSWSYILSGPKGDKGDAGVPGPQGPQGIQGPMFTGTGFVDTTTNQSIGGNKTFTSPFFTTADLYLGKGLVNSQSSATTAPTSISLIRQNNRGIIDALGAYAGQGDYLYCADRNTAYTVTSTVGSIGVLFDNDMSSSMPIPVANLATTPAVITIVKSDGTAIGSSDVISLSMIGHRLYANAGTLTNYTIETKDSAGVWWVETARTGVSDPVGLLSFPLHNTVNAYSNSDGWTTSAYHRVYGVRITINGATGAPWDVNNLNLAAVQIRDVRPAMSPALGIGALDQRGGSLYGDIKLNSVSGTRIGTTATQKLAFFGSTPAIQPGGDAIAALTTLGLLGGTPSVGSSSLYVSTAFLRTINLNSTASLDGTLAGYIGVNGILAINSNQLKLKTFYDTNHYIIYSAVGDGPDIQGYGGGRLLAQTTESLRWTTAGIQPGTTLVQSNGSASVYWLNTYSRTLFLNASAFFSGSTAGVAYLNGDLKLSNANGIYSNATTELMRISGGPANDGAVLILGGSTQASVANTGIARIASTDIFRWSTGGVQIGGTGLATHSLTLGSVSTGLAYYNTTDQTTNYERVRQYWSGDIWNLSSEKGGTGTARSIRLVSNGGASTLAVGGAGTTSYSETQPSGGMFSVTGYLYGASGVTNGLRITPSVTQSATAGYTALLINPTYTSTGSGVKLLLDAQVGGVSKFKVDSTGYTDFVGGYVRGSLEYADGVDMLFSGTTGTKIGTSTTQKIGFFNATPVVQQSATTDVLTALSNLGLRASGASANFTTSGVIDFTGRVQLGSGGFRSGVQLRNANITLAITTALNNRCDATAGSFTITLPAASASSGQTLWFKKIDATANTVTIQCAGSDTIDGSATYVLSTQYKYVEIVNDASNTWLIRGSN